ncbi:MAG: cytochrome c oxidase subunit II [Pseudomonadota bacterium]
MKSGVIKCWSRVFGLAALVAGASALQAAAQSEEGRVGQSAPWQLNFQEPATQMMAQITDLHQLMLWIMAVVSVFVMVLLVIVIMRFNRKANPTPSKFTHNSLLEFVWTAVPVVILVIIAIPSVRLLQLQEDFDKVEPDLVIKATGYQWYWGYEYPDQQIEFESLMLGLGYPEMNDEVREELAEYGYPETAWKLATDTAVVVPIDTTVLMQVTAADVIHAWTIPAFGVKVDAIPGRLNQTWFRAEQIGTFYGQCSELCGKNHSYMPITVKVVSQEDYDAWLEEAKEEFGTADAGAAPAQVATATTAN